MKIINRKITQKYLDDLTEKLNVIVLENIRFIHCKFQGEFTYAFFNTQFVNCTFTNVSHFKNIIISNCIFKDCNFEKSSFSGGIIENIKVVNCNMTTLKFFHTYICDVDITDSTIEISYVEYVAINKVMVKNSCILNTSNPDATHYIVVNLQHKQKTL